MVDQVVIGIDVGTGGCKTVAFDLEGHLIAEAFREYPIHHPRMDWAEQDPDDWWRTTCATLREVISKLDPGSILAVGLTSQREAFVPLDRRGRKLYDSIIWLDMRTIPQEEEIKRLISPERVLRVTGLPVDYIFSAAKLLWFKKNLPNVFKSIDRILFAKDYVAFKLCGEIATDYSMASRTMLFDIHRLCWSEEVCEALDIPVSILPKVIGSWEIVGEVTGEASESTGLPSGTPVVSGGGDRPCEALGAGVFVEGDINIGTGTGTVIEVPLSKPLPDPKGLIDCCCHVVPKTWEYEVIINATGGSLRWFRDNFGYEEVSRSREEGTSPYAIFDQMASDVPVGSNGLFYYPYLWGARAPKFDPLARSAFIGFTYAHGKPAFLRSILEGVAFQYIETLDLVRDLGVQIKRITMTGGEAKSRLWTQIKADVLGVSIEVPEVLDAAALGACILAAMGVGAYRDFDSAVRKMVRVSRIYHPRPETHEKYVKLYEAYQEVYNRYKECFEILAKIASLGLEGSNGS